MFHALIAVALHLLQDPAGSTPRPLGGETFRRAFESAFEKNDAEAIEGLVRSNPTRSVPLFEEYAQIWMALEGEPSALELTALERARVLAEAVDSALEAPGLLQMFEALEALDEAKRERLRMAERWRHEGAKAEGTSDWHAAIEPYASACAVFEALRCDLPLAHVTNDLANCYCALGQYEKAIGYLERARAIFENMGDPRYTARMINNIGLCYSSLGQYEKAIGYVERGLVLKRQLGESPVESLTNLGLCYDYLGQYEKAIELHQQALVLEEEIGDAPGIARSHSNLGSCYFYLGQYEKAMVHSERALALGEKIGNQEQIVTSALNNLGLCCDLLGRSEDALDFYRRALVLKERIGNPQAIAQSLNNLGLYHRARGHHDEAIGYLERALVLREKIGNPQNLAESLYNLGSCYLSVGKHEASLKSFEACVASLSHVSRRSLSEEGRAAFVGQWDDLPLAVSTVVQGASGTPDLDAVERGFPLVESFLSRTMLEGLQERAEGVLAAADPRLSHERDQQLNRMVELRLALARSVEEKDEAAAAGLRESIADEENRLEVLDGTLRAKNPRLKELVAPDVTTVERVRAAVLDADTAMLLYVLGEEASFVWVITTEEATVLSLPRAGLIRATYDRLVGALAGNVLDDQFVTPARELYEQLLAPVSARTGAKHDLLIVPDGFLGFLPFEVLLTRDVLEKERHEFARLPYLLREKTVRYAPSASLLVWIASHGGGQRQEAWRKDMFLMGDPRYASEQTARDTLAQRAAASLVAVRFHRLAESRGEVTALAEACLEESEATVRRELRDMDRSGHVSGARFDLFVGTAASKAALTQDLTGYRIVHLAVHGYFDTEFPWFSGLVLSPAGDASSGFLNTIDIASLHLDAQIVFLSACETAKGQLFKADGIRNTTRSFLLAGARSVIATQWSVADDAARAVAQTFYERLFAGDAPGHALRAAKLNLIERRVGNPSVAERGLGLSRRSLDKDRLTHPAIWAPFVLWGG